MTHEKAAFSIHAETKEKAFEVFEKLGISPDEAVDIFLTEVSFRQGMPFKTSIRKPRDHNAVLKQTRRIVENVMDEDVRRSEIVKDALHDVAPNPEATEEEIKTIEKEELRTDEKVVELEDITAQQLELLEKAEEKAVELNTEIERDQILAEELLERRIKELAELRQHNDFYIQMIMSEIRLQKSGDYWELFQECKDLLEDAERTLNRTSSVDEYFWAEQVHNIKETLSSATEKFHEVARDSNIKIPEKPQGLPE